MKQVPGGQQDNYIFHVVTEGRTYELSVHDEATMNKYVINHITVEISKKYLSSYVTYHIERGEVWLISLYECLQGKLQGKWIFINKIWNLANHR